MPKSNGFRYSDKSSLTIMPYLFCMSFICFPINSFASLLSFYLKVRSIAPLPLIETLGEICSAFLLRNYTVNKLYGDNCGALLSLLTYNIVQLYPYKSLSFHEYMYHHVASTLKTAKIPCLCFITIYQNLFFIDPPSPT